MKRAVKEFFSFEHDHGNGAVLLLLLIAGLFLFHFPAHSLAEKDSFNITITGGGETEFLELDFKKQNHEFTLPYACNIVMQVTNTSTYPQQNYYTGMSVIGVFKLTSENGTNLPFSNFKHQYKDAVEFYHLTLLPGHYTLTMDYKYHGTYEVIIMGEYLPSASTTGIELNIGETFRPSVWSGGLSYQWTSNDENVATVDQSGLVTGINSGTTEVICTFSDGTKSTITVEVYPAQISSERESLLVQQQTQLILENAEGEVNWSSSDKNVAIVDRTGKVTAVGLGRARITAEKNGREYTCDVTVYSTLNGGEVQNFFGKTLAEVNLRLERKLWWFDTSAYTNDYFMVELDQGTGKVNAIALLTDAEYGIGSYTLFGTYPGMEFNDAAAVLASHGWVYDYTYREYIYFSNAWLADKELVVTLEGSRLDLIAYLGDIPEEPVDSVFGLNLDADGIWRYYEDGIFVRRTGIVEYNGGKYFICDGVISWETNSLILVDGRWVLIYNGMFLQDYNGLYYDVNLGWWLVRDGVVDFSYTGLWNDPTYGWWLIGGGTIAWDYTGLWNDAEVGWWLIRNGTIAFDYSGMWNDPNYGWWLIGGGRLVNDYNGLWNDANLGWILVQNGALAPEYNGLFCDPNLGWWLVQNGVVDFGYTGLYYDADVGWWLLGGGAIAWDYNGLWADPNFGVWLVQGGTINFGYTGTFNDPNFGDRYVENGQLVF